MPLRTNVEPKAASTGQLVGAARSRPDLRSGGTSRRIARVPQVSGCLSGGTSERARISLRHRGDTVSSAFFCVQFDLGRLFRVLAHFSR